MGKYFKFLGIVFSAIGGFMLSHKPAELQSTTALWYKFIVGKTLPALNHQYIDTIAWIIVIGLGIATLLWILSDSIINRKQKNRIKGLRKRRKFCTNKIMHPTVLDKQQYDERKKLFGKWLDELVIFMTRNKFTDLQIARFDPMGTWPAQFNHDLYDSHIKNMCAEACDRIMAVITEESNKK